MATVRLEIPARSAYVAVVRLALTALARGTDLDEGALDDLKIAVSEACANAVLANQESGADAPVSITWSDDGGRYVVEVGDRGSPSDADADASDSQGFASRLVMSRALVQSLVDEFDVAPRPDGGTCTRLVMHAPRD